jgi:hypothetical protein
MIEDMKINLNEIIVAIQKTIMILNLMEVTETTRKLRFDPPLPFPLKKC